MIKVFGFIQSLLETCIYNKVSGSATTFLISICEWHIVDPKWCKISGKHKGLFERSFSKEDLDKATYILGIKIHRDRSRRLMILSKAAHLVTQPRTPSLLIYFELFQNHVKVCVLWKYHQASWSISIDLDAQYVSSFIQVFLWKSLFKQPFMRSRNSTLFQINNMSFTYTYQKCCSAPTHFIVNTSF